MPTYISVFDSTGSDWKPESDDTYDLGTSSKEWKDIYIDGTGYIDTAQIAGLTLGGTLNMNGNATTGLTYIQSNDNAYTDIVYGGMAGGDIVFRTTDGGTTKTNRLQIAGTTGAVDFLGHAVSNVGNAGNDFGASNTLVATTLSGSLDMNGQSINNIGNNDILDTVTVIKSSDEALTSNDSLQADDELLFAVGTNQKWVFDIYVLFNAHNTPDIQFGFTVPANATYEGVELGIVTASLGSSTRHSGDGTTQMIRISGSVISTDTSGNATLTWAQKTSDGNATSVLENSMLVAKRLT